MPRPEIATGVIRRCAAAFTLAILAAGCEPSADAQPASNAAQAAAVPQGEGFDFYVLSLSWSPSYCEAEGSDANRQQCGSGRRHGFVVHGLWPQFERGYPEYCPSRKPERVPDAIVRRNLDLMPSAGLIGHQWRKHGSCTGLSQARYFEVVRAAADRIAIPAAYRNPDADRQVDPDGVEADFIAANAGLSPNGIAVTCDRRFLREIRICMAKDLAFRECPEIQRSECNLGLTGLPSP